MSKYLLLPFGRRLVSKVIAPLFSASILVFTVSAHANPIEQTNLVTDNQSVLMGLGYAPAAHLDPNLVNPWGASHTGSSPFWVSDNGTGLATLYNSSGVPQALVVTIPGGFPTGQVFNPTSNLGSFNGDIFLFGSESGTISGWRGALLTTAETLQIGSAANVYKGEAIATVGGHTYLYSANFRTGTIDVLKGDASAPDLPGKFTDPNLPSGYAPFNVQVLNGTIYVTYALQDAAKHDDVPGPGNGFVSAFDLTGNFIKRVASGGTLNSPWGLDIAPPGFGDFANDLLVGNFGDGKINVFDPGTSAFLGQLVDASGNPIAIDGLWALINGNGGNGGNPNLVYFTAGINNEADGLFGSLAAVPEPSSLALLSAGLFGLGILQWRRRLTGRRGLLSER